MSISYFDVLVDYEALVNQINEVLQVLEEHQDYSNHAPIAVSIYALRGLVDTHKKKHSKLHHAGKYRGTHRH